MSPRPGREAFSARDVHGHNGDMKVDGGRIVDDDNG